MDKYTAPPPGEIRTWNNAEIAAFLDEAGDRSDNRFHRELLAIAAVRLRYASIDMFFVGVIAGGILWWTLS